MRNPKPNKRNIKVKKLYKFFFSKLKYLLGRKRGTILPLLSENSKRCRRTLRLETDGDDFNQLKDNERTVIVKVVTCIILIIKKMKQRR